MIVKQLWGVVYFVCWGFSFLNKISSPNLHTAPLSRKWFSHFMSVFCICAHDPGETSGTPPVLLKHKHTRANSRSVPQRSHHMHTYLERMPSYLQDREQFAVCNRRESLFVLVHAHVISQGCCSWLSHFYPASLCCDYVCFVVCVLWCFYYFLR